MNMKIKIPALISVLLMGASCNGTSVAGQADAGDDSLDKIIRDRRSVRRYTDEGISRDTLENIVKFGMYAPSSYGQNPVEFVVVDDKEELAGIAGAKRIGAPSVRDAAAAIVVVVDKTKGELWIEDSSVAAGYILLGAERYGLGACWNQIRGREGQRLSASKEICGILGIPSRYEVLCVIALGHKGEDKAPHTDSELDMDRLHFEKFAGK